MIDVREWMGRMVEKCYSLPVEEDLALVDIQMSKTLQQR